MHHNYYYLRTLLYDNIDQQMHPQRLFGLKVDCRLTSYVKVPELREPSFSV